MAIVRTGRALIAVVLFQVAQLIPEDARKIGLLTNVDRYPMGLRIDRLTSADRRIDLPMNVDPLLVDQVIDRLTSVDPLLVDLRIDRLTSVDPLLVDLRIDLPTNVDPLLVDQVIDLPTSVDPLLVDQAIDLPMNVDPLLGDQVIDLPTSVDPLLVDLKVWLLAHAEPQDMNVQSEIFNVAKTIQTEATKASHQRQRHSEHQIHAGSVVLRCDWRKTLSANKSRMNNSREITNNSILRRLQNEVRQ
jgi:hypothetical protein